MRVQDGVTGVKTSCLFSRVDLSALVASDRAVAGTGSYSPVLMTAATNGPVMVVQHLAAIAALHLTAA